MSFQGVLAWRRLERKSYNDGDPENIRLHNDAVLGKSDISINKSNSLNWLKWNEDIYCLFHNKTYSEMKGGKDISKVTDLNLGLKPITFVVKNHMETSTGIDKVI